MADSTPPRETELVFQQTVEGLFHVGLRGRVTPELEARLRNAGLDLSRPLAPAYPRSAWNHFIRLTAETLWPDSPPELAYHALGRQLLTGYAETLVGKALATIQRLVGPKRTLERMTHNFRSGANYNLTRVTHVGPGEALFWMNEPHLHPSYVAGILDAALCLAGAEHVDIRVLARDTEGCTYRIHWGA
ncbi:MAG: DUF2378 family protein [Myxococcaceae bacterium]|nr:DUF2378 family protein [Myxococcaceae bacterium]